MKESAENKSKERRRERVEKQKEGRKREQDGKREGKVEGRGGEREGPGGKYHRGIFRREQDLEEITTRTSEGGRNSLRIGRKMSPQNGHTHRQTDTEKRE